MRHCKVTSKRKEREKGRKREERERGKKTKEGKERKLSKESEEGKPLKKQHVQSVDSLQPEERCAVLPTTPTPGP